MEEGKFYLFACPFFWTFVGRYKQHLNFQELVIADAIYFTRTGATFGRLCTSGLILTGDTKSVYDILPGEPIIPAQGPKIQWFAETPWVKRKK